MFHHKRSRRPPCSASVHRSKVSFGALQPRAKEHGPSFTTSDAPTAIAESLELKVS